jgi:nitrile hydratase accessory protein
MTERSGIAALDTTGPGAPPRQNGELVFASPWESRLFGLTMALYEAGLFDWEEFRRLLIDAVARREGSSGEWSYYACWLEAFETLLEAKRLCGRADLEPVIQQLASRPAGHDHRHDDHDHDHS